MTKKQDPATQYRKYVEGICKAILKKITKRTSEYMQLSANVGLEDIRMYLVIEGGQPYMVHQIHDLVTDAISVKIFELIGFTQSGNMYYEVNADGTVDIVSVEVDDEESDAE